MLSLGWKKFSFFEQSLKREHEFPEAASCCCPGPDVIVAGCADGSVAFLDRELQMKQAFQAHAKSTDFVAFLSKEKLLITLGHDEGPVLVNLKVWNLEGQLKSSTASPPCLKTLKVFAPKQPEADITALAVHEENWPHMSLAIGLANGNIYCILGDIGKDKAQRTTLTLQPASTPITNLNFTGDNKHLHLYVTTQTSIAAVDVKTSSKVGLDEAGAGPGCAVLNQEGELIVGRDEAFYFNTLEGRGPCFACEGHKQQLQWFRSYIAAVLSTPSQQGSAPTHLFQVFDLRNKLIATSVPLTETPKHVVCSWGMILVIQAGGLVTCLKEKELTAKLELLYNKSLYLLALNLAQSQQADASSCAEIQRRYADHLYSKHDYDGAMTQYVSTIGYLEPSYVIRKFLDAQRIHNLTSYLEQLHEQGKASADHTTLLLNCYTKLKDVDKLDRFLRGSGAPDSTPSLNFDVETAVKVCRAAGYFQHALFVCQAAAETQWYLDILLEDMQSWEDALAYLQDLPRQQAAAALKKHGKVLLNNMPEATTALLMQLCTPGDASKPDGDWIAKVSDFAHLAADRPMALMLLCEFILNSTQAPPGEEFLYHTLLELHLMGHEDEPPQLPRTTPSGAATASTQDEGEAAAPAGHLPQHDNQVDQAQRQESRRGSGAQAGTSSASRLGPAHTLSPQKREATLELLKRGWPLGEESKYDTNHALVLCRMHGFTPGLRFLYERMRHFREVLQVHMAAGDHGALIEDCMRLGDVSRGGDPHLWSEVLEYFARQSGDCTEQVGAVLHHIEAGNLLPPLVVLAILAKNPTLQLRVVKNYIARQLSAESAHIQEDRAQIAKYQQETAQMRAEVKELRTQARVFQNSKCALSGAPLELPAVHFVCGHSFNLRSLGENEKECPICAPQFRSILDIKRAMRSGATEQDKFFAQLKSNPNGFSVIADFFGRGLLDAASISTARSTL
ncbi:hypothetical protein ABBQ32_013114 [Trebouxia sp. C0010 RCD-2024]